MERIFLGLGSNLGDRRANLLEATAQIAARVGAIQAVSNIYETQAWGIQDQPDFLNQVLEIRSSLNPEVLLDEILKIEQDMGRERRIKWGERLIDIDILFYGSRIVQTEKLTIPHPFLHQRNFVLFPLFEIAADWVHPVLRKTVSDLVLFSEDISFAKILTE